MIFFWLCILLKIKTYSKGRHWRKGPCRERPGWSWLAALVCQRENNLHGLQRPSTRLQPLPQLLWVENTHPSWTDSCWQFLAGCTKYFPVILLLRSPKQLEYQQQKWSVLWAVNCAVCSFSTSRAVRPGSQWIDSQWTSFRVSAQPLFLPGFFQWLALSVLRVSLKALRFACVFPQSHSSPISVIMVSLKNVLDTLPCPSTRCSCCQWLKLCSLLCRSWCALCAARLG